jgi:Big-like domain-containing protein
VTKAPLPVTTQVAPTTVTLGASFRDTATLGAPPAGEPTPTGTVTFNVYGPSDTTCAGPVLFTSTNAVNAAGTTATSATFTPGAPGTYRVIATYSGDANYLGSASSCGDPAEAVVVTKAPLPVTTQVAPTTVTLGSSFQDTATLGAPPAGEPTPTGTVTFNVYGPSDTSCAGPVLFTSTNPVNAAGTSAVSGTFTPGAAGTYRVVATYSGDANYSGSASSCGDPKEAVVVSNALLGIATSASVAADGSFSDTASLSGAPVGAPVATGSVTFDVYGPADSSCSAAPVFTSTNPLNAAGTSATSSSFKATTASGGPGTYRFVARYSGDGNYSTVASLCNATGESVVIPMPVIGVTKVASPLSLPEPGGTFTFTIQVSNPSTVDPITITTLTDNIYGNLATRAGSTCGALIGVVLAPGAKSAPCSFTGPFSGKAGASQTDTVTVTGVDVNGFPASSTAMATVTLTPSAPQIGVTKVADPLTMVAPGGTFKFTVQVSNPSTLEPVTITSLTDNIYGNLATRAGSTCGALIGVVLAPGATSAPCTFTGPFSGVGGATQTDVVTVVGTNNGTSVSATAHATVSLTSLPSVVSSSTLHRPSGCVEAKTVKIYVTGSNIKSVSYSLDGKHLGTATKRDSSGRYTVTVKTGGLSLRMHHLVAVVTYRSGKTRTLHADIARCQPPKLPLFTG